VLDTVGHLEMLALRIRPAGRSACMPCSTGVACPLAPVVRNTGRQAHPPHSLGLNRDVFRRLQHRAPSSQHLVTLTLLSLVWRTRSAYHCPSVGVEFTDGSSSWMATVRLPARTARREGFDSLCSPTGLAG